MSISGHQKPRVRVSRHRRQKQNNQGDLVYQDPYALQILDLLGTYVWLRTDQVERLMADTVSKATMGRRLRWLYDAKLVGRIQLPVNNRQIIHTLTARGAKHLEENGHTVRYWQRKHLIPGRHKGDLRGYFKLEHPLLANEIVIRLILSAKRLGYEYKYQDAASLVKRMKKVYPDKRLLIIPEGDPARAFDLFIEADTGEMHKTQIMTKLKRYFEYLDSLDRTDSLDPPRAKKDPLILFVTNREKRQNWRVPRVIEIANWALAFAQGRDMGGFCELIRISHLRELEGENIFGEPVWLIPTKTKPQPLYQP